MSSSSPKSESEEVEIMEQLHSESQLWGYEGEDGAGEADEGNRDQEERSGTTSHDQPEKMRWFDLRHPGLALVLWYILLGLPASIGVTLLNREFLRWVGYEKIMRSPSGIMGSRILFATTNVIIIAAWAVQLTEESKETRIRRLKEEAEWWKNACAVLEEEKEFLMKQNEAHKPPHKLGNPFGMMITNCGITSEAWDERRNLEHSDYYPPTPKDMIKEVLARRARND